MFNKALGLIFLVSMLVLSGCESENNTGNTEAEAGDTNPAALASGETSVDISIALKPAQMDWVGQKIFQNECAGQFQCLVHWNDGEAFPSLGIGHFIWYPEGVNERFVESFPALVEYMKQRQVNIPGWLRELEPFDAPWPDKSSFEAVDDSVRVAELREFLAGTQGIQAEFIFRRAKSSLVEIVESLPEDRKAQVRADLKALSRTPGGTYALMDYVNFKGEGLSPSERYDGVGWGLRQVLLAMEPDPNVVTLARFREAAAQVLTTRANNADNPIEKTRWLKGWLKRLETYKQPDDVVSSAEKTGIN
ncbi:hypothetical protein [Marinobacter sp. 1_MG-2023]|uniref:hypothetical protein n=1 Tax=Marinobacter sp. 1_MG-2023 TaxID=3062627 RepID=UPI0026E3D9BE|nr:hypothetical protein [Marinobacter sp. 1_MG-2023]MDO6823496.1 hypothetical protein [Marinobacter sp. 1_MG-2023]